MSRADPPKKTNTALSSPTIVALAEALPTGSKPLGTIEWGALSIELFCGAQSLWAVARRPGHGGFALRLAYVGSDAFEIAECSIEPGSAKLRVDSGIGRHQIELRTNGADWPALRATTRFVPERDMRLPFVPRDLYPLGRRDNPLDAIGEVEAAQRGLNAPLVFLQLKRPRFGTLLYFQNLTALNPYFLTTRTKPDGAIGGDWPELGFLLPAPVPGQVGQNLLCAGEEVTLSDSVIAYRQQFADGEADVARQFLQLLAAVYREIERPVTMFRDWRRRALATLRDLESAREATIRHYGQLYVRPYTDAEYPDSMVQMMVLSAVHDWGRWQGKPHPLEDRLRKGMRRFHDRKLRALRRYLPNVGADKNADAVDSWYPYHALLHMARLALHGDRYCRALFVDSLDHAVRAARHFKYAWPIQYRIDDFSVLTEARNQDGLGQTDVGGLYAYVMLQAHELTGERLYLDEAIAALDALQGMRFELQYQANLTAWGAAACIRLWRLTREQRYLEQSYVFLASFFHNATLWDSQIGNAAHYDTFMGVACLHDAPYMAMYECYDAFIAFERYLEDAGPDVDPAARLLVSEYCKYALDYGWSFYPDTLPEAALATEIRNGHIDPKLNFPLEDLYPDGQPAGQVGQEIYGAGAALAFATRSFHRPEGVPFEIFADHFVRALEHLGEDRISLQFDGGEGCTARIALLPKAAAADAAPRLFVADQEIAPACREKSRIEYIVGARERVLIEWRVDR